MPTFGLFGHDFALNEGNNSFSDIGGTPVGTCKFNLDSVHKRLSGNLVGLVCGAQITLSFQATINITGNRVVLSAAPTGVDSNRLILQYSSGTTGADLKNPRLDVHPDSTISLTMRDQNESALRWLGQSSRLPPIVAMIEQGKGTLIHLDVCSGRVVHRVPQGGSTLSWQDAFFWADGPQIGSIGPSQQLDIGSLWFDNASYEVEARPHSGALFLHGDVLDTTKSEDNEYLFQYAVANGRLRIIGTRSGTANPRTFWSKDTALEPSIVLLRYQDEHGHPVALVPDAGTDIPITYRSGPRSPIGSDTNPASWDFTNAAMVIGPHDSATNTKVSGRLSSLDPLALYDTFSDPTAAKNSLDNPSFLRNRTVPLQDAPAELHGLSRGLRLERTGSGPIAAWFDVTGVEQGEGGFSFHKTELVLADCADLNLTSLMEERDVAPQVGITTLDERKVGAFRFEGKRGELRLPAIDLQYALSNLAGRRNTSGAYLGTGKLLKSGKDHLENLETQLSGTSATRFRVSSLDRQRHVAGVRIYPAENQPFARTLDRLPTLAENAKHTGRPGPDLAAQSAPPSPPLRAFAAAPAAAAVSYRSNFVLGGEDSDIKDQLAQQAEHAQTVVGGAFKIFEKAWRGNVSHPLVVKLRDLLGISMREAIGADQASDLLEVAIAYVNGSDNIDDITEDAEGLLRYLASITGEEFAELWLKPAPPGFAALLEHIWSPADNDLLRRIVRSLIGHPDAPALGALLFGTPNVASLLGILENPVPGLLTDLQRGLDSAFDEVVDLWATSLDPLMVRLRGTYGPVLSRDIYAKLLDPSNSADAALLLAVIRAEPDFGTVLRTLADLATDPPDYIFRTGRFQVNRASQDERIGALWNQCFDLCSFMGDDSKLWTFFLGGSASVIVKLSQKRSLADLIREVHAQYRSSERPDPLGLPAGVDAFIDTLDVDLLAADWTGAFVIHPIADISKDLVLRDLAGFDHIEASYVAVGGRKPASSAARKPSIDIWAHVFKQKDAGSDLKNDPSPIADLKMALTKFDVRVRQTRLSDANIEVELYPQDVWGRKGQPTTGKPFDKIVLHGTLEPPGKDPNAPSDLVFAAFFPNPFVIPIHLAFVKELALNSLRVARRSGVTCVEIDGSLSLQNKVDGLDLQLDLDDDTRLFLQDFRIQVPSLPNLKVEVGTLRKLGFDFPALSFAIPKPRAFNVFGIEMIPSGLGYVRGSESALNRLRDDYIWLRRLDISGENPGVFVPYIEFEADFGKLPGFGLVDARGLRFRLALALKISNGAAVDGAYLGISGLDARDLRIDLFRLLTLEMEHLRISPAKLIAKGENPTAHKPDAGAILAEGIKLKILNWSPVPDRARFDLLLLHPTARQAAPQRKGMLAVYDAQAAPDPGGGQGDDGKFFQLFWALLAHNLELPTDVLNHLLSKSPGDDDPVGLLKSLVAKPPEGSDPNTPRADLVLEGVKLLDKESWLFGLSFALGELFKRCNLVLHDQHYYGIHIWAEWVEAVFGQDSIELAYIPGPTRSTDRFRTNLRIPALDMLGSMKSGEVALEWAVNWDFLVDIGFPWRTSIGYDWFRAFSVPVGAYEGKFGFYFEKRTVAIASGEKLMLSAGVGLYVGYFFGAGNSIAWVRAGIGVFAIMQGTITFRATGRILSPAILKASIDSIEIVGVVGIFAYGEGGVDVWIISARFRVSAQASVECRILYVVSGSCSLTYTARLSAGYSASVRVGCGFCSWTFSVSGSVQMGVSGHLLLS
jgi:hypothetical protein